MSRIVQVGVVPVTADAPRNLINLAVKEANIPRGLSIRLVNSYSLALANTNNEYGRALSTSGLNIIDGKPLSILASMVLGTRVSNIRGGDFFESVMALSENDQTIKHAFIGGDPASKTDFVQALYTKFPDNNIVGVNCPPFGEITEHYIGEIEKFIRNCGANIVWLGLGTPKQDLISTKLAERLPIKFIGIGAVFNFLSGDVKEAPKWVQKIGLEWLFRLLAEPKRLWKRYLWGNSIFLSLAVKTLVASRKH